VVNKRIAAAFVQAQQARSQHTLVRAETVELMRKLKELLLHAQAIVRRKRTFPRAVRRQAPSER